MCVWYMRIWAPVVAILGVVAPDALRLGPTANPAPPAAMAGSVQIVQTNGLLLTRIEHNCGPAGLAGCADVVIYNHGFPDSSVVPTAMQDFVAASETGDARARTRARPETHARSTKLRNAGAGAPDHLYFSSRLPRKVCEYVMKHVPNTAFVAFNTRGVPGSSAAPPGAIDIAPPEFERKTLTGLCVLLRPLCAHAHWWN